MHFILQQYRINVGGNRRGKATSKWVLCFGSEHKGEVTRVVTSEWGGDIGMRMDVSNSELSEQRVTLAVTTEWGDI